MPALGTCYKDAWHWIMHYTDWTLVHGMTKCNFGGHAWCEKDDQLYDPTTDKVINKDDYYNDPNVKALPGYKYSHTEAAKWACKTRHFGPWEQQDWSLGTEMPQDIYDTFKKELEEESHDKRKRSKKG